MLITVDEIAEALRLPEDVCRATAKKLRCPENLGKGRARVLVAHVAPKKVNKVDKLFTTRRLPKPVVVDTFVPDMAALEVTRELIGYLKTLKRWLSSSRGEDFAECYARV